MTITGNVASGVSGRKGVNDGEIKIMTFGDSLTAQASSYSLTSDLHEAVGVINHLNYLTNYRYKFQHGLNKGVSGDTTTQMLARIFETDTPSYDHAIVGGGINDINSGVSAATIISNLDAICDHILAKQGVRMTLNTVTPVTDAVYLASNPTWTSTEIDAANLVMTTVNTHIRSKENFGNLRVADHYSVIDDGTQTPIANTVVDGLHKSPIGARLEAELHEAIMTPIYGKALPVSDFSDSILLNSDMTGTGGSIGSGSTGVMPTSWTATNQGSIADTAQRTYSKDADDNLVIVLDMPSGGSNKEGVYIDQLINAPDFLNYANYELICDVDVTAVSGVLDKISLICREENSTVAGTNIRHNGMDDYTGRAMPVMGSGQIRSPIFRTQSDSDKLRCRLELLGDTTSGAIGLTITIKSMTLVQKP